MEPNNILPPELVDQMLKDRKVRTAITKQSHYYFFNFYLAHYVKYETASFQKEMFYMTEQRDIKNLFVMAFRGSGKSTILTLSYPIWAILGEQQIKFVVILCQTKAQAKQMMLNIRRELETNVLLKNDLGPFEEESDEWGSFALVFKELNAKIMAASTETSIRGLRHNQYRPQLVICDDVEDLNSVKTHESRQKTYQWFTGEVIPAGDVETRFIVCGNYLHDDSLLMHLKRDLDEKRISGEFRQYPLVTEDGRIMWQGKYQSLEDIDTEKKKVGSDASWNREYLLRFVSDEDQVIHPDWIRRWTDKPMHDDYRKIVIGVDLAISDRDTACFTSIVSIAISGYENVFEARVLPNVINKRMNFPETLMAIKELYAQCLTLCRNVEILIEDVGYQRAIVQQLCQQGYNAIGMRPNGDKRARLLAVSPYLERDLIRFPDEEIGGAPLAELIRQLVGFGKERYDDLADAFSVAGLGVIDADERGPRIGWIDNYNGSYSETKLFADEYSNGKLRWGVPFNPFEQINQ